MSAKGRLTLLHSLDASYTGPIGEVLQTSEGTLFGTTRYGTGCEGLGCGTIWSYAP